MPDPARVTQEQSDVFSQTGLFRFDPRQRRGPDGRWIDMEGIGIGGGIDVGLPRTGQRRVPDLPAGHHSWASPEPGPRPTVDLPDYNTERAAYNRKVVEIATKERDSGLQGHNTGFMISSLEEALATDPNDPGYDQIIRSLRAFLNRNGPAYGELPDRPEPSEGVAPPVLPDAPATTGGARPPTTGSPVARAQALDRSVRSGIKGQRVLSGGQMGDTRLVKLKDDTTAVYKQALKPWGDGWGPKEQTDAEELASDVAAALGAPAPTIRRVNDDTLYMETVPGGPGTAYGNKMPERLRGSDQAKKLGLLDVLTNNTDRHGGNWMLDGDNFYGIDHGLAFRMGSIDESNAKISPFATEHFISPQGKYKASIPLSKSDVAHLRHQLEALRPKFVARGRGAWLDQVQQRLEKLAPRAKSKTDLYTAPGAAVTAAQRGAFAHALADPSIGVLAFNPHQRRGPDGRWIKMDVSELKAPRRRGRAGVDAPEALPAPHVPQAPAPAAAPAVGFKPRPDAEWAMLQKRLGKRTPRLDPEGDLQVGDVVPTRDGKWTTVEGGQVYPRRWEGTYVNVRDDSKGYRHTESIEGIKKLIEQYRAEKAWREANAPEEGTAYAQLNANRRPGEPEIKDDGKYAKPTKQYAVWNGETYTRTSRSPYRYASVVASKDNPEGFILSWHRTAAGAQRGTLEASQRDYFYVKDIVETGFEKPPEPLVAAAGEPSATAMQRWLFEFAFNPHQRRGPDGRWIRMPTVELKRPRRGGKAPKSPLRVVKKNGKHTYHLGGRERQWTPAEARAVADALDATAAGESVPAPIPGKVVSDGVRRKTVGQVQPFRGANGNIILDIGRDNAQGDSGEVELTTAQARKLAQDLRKTADDEEGAAPGVDPPEYATQLPPINLPDPQVAYREARDEYNLSVYNVAWTHRQKNQDRRRPDEALDELMKEYDGAAPGWIRDEVADHLRIHLDSYYDGRDILDPRPEEDAYMNVPSLPLGPRTSGGARPAVGAPIGQREAALDRSVRSGLESQQPLAGGAIGDTRRIKLGDGTDAIYKRAKAPVGRWSPQDQTDAEGLASLVAEAVGVRAPAVKQASPTELYMEVMPGTSAAAHGWRLAPRDILDSDEGLKMGLLDILLNNSDRHTGNWMWDNNEREIAAIDHGFAFMPGSGRWASSPFTDRFLDSDRSYNPTSPLTPSDVSHVRQGLERIRPQFEALGRGDWYQGMLLRLNKLDSAATGTRDLYPRGAVTAARHTAFASRGTLEMDATQGGTK